MVFGLSKLSLSENTKDRNSARNRELRSLVGKLFVFCGLLETLFEFSDAATGIENSLLAGVERVADRADFNEERSALDR
jgi:hypothetical protein